MIGRRSWMSKNGRSGGVIEMAIEPTKKIYESPVIRREENAGKKQRKGPKQQKEERHENRKVDIKA